MLKKTPQFGQPEKEPAIRTMKTDISEFLKTNKPSLISILVRQAELEEYREAGKTKFISLKTAAAILAVITAIGGGFAAYRLSGGVSRPATEPAAEAASYIFFDDTESINIDGTGHGLLPALREAGRRPGIPGTFRRLVVRLKTAGGAEAPVGLAQFLELSGMRLPSSFVENAAAPPQFFIYQQGSGPVFGLMAEIRKPERVLQGLMISEAQAQRDWEVMFLGSPPPSNLEIFKDLTYKNVDFRYLAMDKESDRGLGYLNFQAKRLMVIATSQESLRLVIDRLFQNR